MEVGEVLPPIVAATLICVLAFITVTSFTYLFGSDMKIAPRPDVKPIHPWITDLMSKEADDVNDAISQRLSLLPAELSVLVDHIKSYTPKSIIWSNRRTGFLGYVTLLRKSTRTTSWLKPGEHLLFGQPLDAKIVERLATFYDPSIRSMMQRFWTVCARVGDEMAGSSGNFGGHDPANIIVQDENALGNWRDSRELYSSRDGDSVLINAVGETAWHQHETGSVLPLCQTFPDFIDHWVAMRDAKLDFSSWNSLEFLGRNSDQEP